MTKTKRLILLTFLTFVLRTSFAQTTDSLTIYPNPFKSSATISFKLVKADTISLTLLNLLGQTMQTYLQDTVLTSGTYSINIIGDSLADASYIVILKIGTTKTLGKHAIKDGSISDIELNTVNDIFPFFPNPTTDLLAIPIEGAKTITVTDLRGRILKSTKTDLKTISLLGLPSGQYFITISNDKNQFTRTQKIWLRE